MTRANIYIRLRNGKTGVFVKDGDGYPEGTEALIMQILNAKSDKEIIKIIDATGYNLNEYRCNASYRYYIDLMQMGISMYEENYNYTSDVFHRGKEESERLTQETKIPQRNIMPGLSFPHKWNKSKHIWCKSKNLTTLV